MASVTMERHDNPARENHFMTTSKTNIVDLVRAYNPADPEHDFDAIKARLPSSYETFSTLCSLLKTSLVSVPLLLALDLLEVLRDVQQNDQIVFSEFERWIGYVPENRPSFPRLDWFQRLARAGLTLNEPRLLRKIIRLGHAKIVAELDEWSNCHAALFRETAFGGEKSSKWGDSLLLTFLSRQISSTEDTQSTERLLTTYLSECPDARDWIGSLLLNRKTISPATKLFVLLRAIQVDNDFFERMTAVWSDQAFVKQSNASRHAQVSAVVRFCLWTFKGKIKESTVSLIIHGVSEHLGSNVEERRRLGMIVGEEFSVCHETGETLDFGVDRSSFVDEYANVASEASGSVFAANVIAETTKCDTNRDKQDVISPSLSTAKQDVMLDDPDAIVPWPWKAPPAHFFAPMEEDGEKEEDDDACSLEPYDLTDDPLEGLAMVPKHLNQIPALLASDKYESVQVAMVHLAAIIRVHSNRPETRRRAARMIWTLLELENKFNLADFELNRSKALVAFIVCVPRESGPALARAVYSREINVGTKLVALNALIEGTRLLAEGGFADDLTLAEPDDAVEADGQRLLGTVLRKSKRLNISSSKKKVAPNLLAPFGYEFFFQPLCRRVADFENEPILLCKVVTTLGFVVERCRHAAGEALRMAESLVELLPWMNLRPEAEIRRATLYALAAIATVSREMIDDWQGWIWRVSEEDPDLVVREMAKRLVQGS